MRTINIPTPTGTLRQPGHKIDTIVIHAMSEYFDHNGEHKHATQLLNSMGLSCHYMVTPGGSIIKCADPRELTAWHAKGHNFNSIGIELLVPGINDYDDFVWAMKNVSWISDTQDNALAHLCSRLIVEYDINAHDGIKLHCEIDPERKVDPGMKHDWDEFINKVVLMGAIS